MSFKDATGDARTNNIKYDEAGRITSFFFETGNPDDTVIQYFAYDANGIEIKKGELKALMEVFILK